MPGRLPLLDHVLYLPPQDRFGCCVSQTKKNGFGILKLFAVRMSILAFGSEEKETMTWHTRKEMDTHLRIANTPHVVQSYAL